MPKKIIIVRHGETEWNVERRLQGWSDIPLNQQGRQQAKKVADRLKSESITTIYSSDHKRAKTTARAIAKAKGLKLHQTWKLREDRMGIFEGWQWEKEPDPHKESLWQQRTKARKNGDIHWKPEGGESLLDHAQRVKEFLDVITRKHERETVLIVSHGGTINRIIEHFGFKKHTDEYIRFQNTSVTIINHEGDKYHLQILNDISHLYD
ncbi:histidine phosphatase family protein [Candidatus Woesebacteria bacterium]|nr:histidine phosphatase family protein [Candidatus Woesebacteria bacterium]